MSRQVEPACRARQSYFGVVTNSTVHVIGHLLTSIDIDSAVCFINGTETANGQTVVRGRVFDIDELMITTEYLPISAGSDVFLESFTYFAMDMLPLRLDSSLHVHDEAMQETACQLHGVTISYQQDMDASDNSAALPAKAVPATASPSAPIAPPSTSSYTVALNKWSNCRATDPVQVVVSASTSQSTRRSSSRWSSTRRWVSAVARCW